MNGPACSKPAPTRAGHPMQSGCDRASIKDTNEASAIVFDGGWRLSDPEIGWTPTKSHDGRPRPGAQRCRRVAVAGRRDHNCAAHTKTPGTLLSTYLGAVGPGETATPHRSAA